MEQLTHYLSFSVLLTDSSFIQLPVHLLHPFFAISLITDPVMAPGFLFSKKTLQSSKAFRYGPTLI